MKLYLAKLAYGENAQCSMLLETCKLNKKCNQNTDSTKYQQGVERQEFSLVTTENSKLVQPLWETVFFVAKLTILWPCDHNPPP